MKTIIIKAVILTDGDNYLIHGSSDETPEAMFKAASPIWAFDPSKETAHYVEIPVDLRELESTPPADVPVSG